MQLQEDFDQIPAAIGNVEQPSSAGGFKASAAESGVDVLAAIWRYRWAVIVPAVIGMVVGAVLWARLPETFESSARILVESDKPLILDSANGNLVSGVPGADVIRAQLFSDRVLDAAAIKMEEFWAEGGYADDVREEAMAIINEEYGSFRNFAREHAEFEPETETTKSPESLAFMLSVSHTNKTLVELSVRALNDSLKHYFDEKNKGSLSQIKEVIQKAVERQAPAVDALETEYLTKLQATPELQASADGLMMNRLRLEEQQLGKRLAELEVELESAQAELSLVQSTVKVTGDPITAIDVVGQILGKEIITPTVRRERVSVKEEDFDLRWLEYQEKLTPLYVERQRAAGEYGENHPSVSKLDDQIKYSEEMFEELTRKFTERLSELNDDSAKIKEEAEAAVATTLTALEGKVAKVTEQVRVQRVELNRVRTEADALAASETQLLSLRRRIEREEALLTQLNELLARANLSENDGGLKLIPLTAPTSAVIVGPILALLLAGGAGMGLLVGVGLAYLLESQAGTFRSAEEIGYALGINVMSHVPYDPGKIRKTKKAEPGPYDHLDDKLSVVHRPMSMSAEAIRALRTSVFFEAAGGGHKVLQVTSPLPSDGKTTVVGNLAASIAQAGKSVLIIDADLRRPQLSDNFGLESERGLSNILNGDATPESVVVETPIDNLSVLPSGPIPKSPAEALSLPQMSELLQWARTRYDYVIVDTPPLLIVTDASILASMVDGVLLTIKVRRKSKANAREAVSILRSVRANILGVIVNASDDSTGSDGYRGYGYYRYSRYAPKYGSYYRKPQGSTNDSIPQRVRGASEPVRLMAPSGRDEDQY